jgi:CrcB protein
MGRWLVGLAAGTLTDLPLGTFAVNIGGAFLMGLLLGRWAVLGSPGTSALVPFLTTGVLGGFTTFSALAVDTVGLLDGGRAGWASVYVAATVVAGLAAVRAGVRAGTRGHD